MSLSAEVSKHSHGNVDILHRYISTPQWNFGVDAQAHLLNNLLDNKSTEDITRQADIYRMAKKYADASGIKRVIHVGIGRAIDLMDVFAERELEVIFVEYARPAIVSERNYSSINHVECDISSWHEVLSIVEKYRDGVPTVVLCNNIIELLPDPRPLLAFIRLLLAESADSRCFFSTQDRSILRCGCPASKSVDPVRIREWTSGEFRNLLRASGLHVAHMGNIRANVHDDQAGAILAECLFDASLYREALAQNGIVVENLSSVMVTSEYPGLIASGGIGTFVADWHHLHEGSAILTTFEFDRKKKPRGDFIIAPSDVLDVSKVGDVGTADVLLQAVTQLLFMCPDIREIHFQEYLGVGLRIAQAKKAGVLPDTLTIFTHCHGNQHYLENANQNWLGVDAQKYAVQEKICIDLSDRVIFPSLFLRDLYIKSGITVDDDRAIICPYRYTNTNVNDLNHSNIKRIVFIGKFMHMKGFDLFCESFDKNFCKVLKAQGIEEIAFIGRGNNRGYINEAAIKRHFKLTVHTEYDLIKLISYVREHRSDSLFVEPYRGDNFPLAVYDVVGNGGLLLAGNAGGIPEMFQAEVWQECLTDLSVESLRQKICELVDWSSDKRSRIVEELSNDLRQANDKVDTIKYEQADKANIELLSSTVMIPFYNTNINEFTDLLKSLNQQSLHPTEIIIVNDASEQKSRIEMEEVAQKHLNIPFRIIDHPYNRGLAAARNTALAACRTELLLNADSDDVPLNDWVKTIVIALSRNPSAAAAVPYLAAFDDGTDFNLYHQKGQYVYRPLGDGFITSQVQNELGHANSGYRVSYAKGMGGWDATSKAKYEDWAFYLNVIANGFRIAIIPKVTCLYRVRKNSMARTYSEWPGQIRLYQTTNGLSRFESLQLQRLCRIASKLVEIEELKGGGGRRVVRIKNAISRQLKRVPVVYFTLRKIILFYRKYAPLLRGKV
ncbi:glycosyltransferase [Brucella anthropi]|uniref:glycosyltransferase n=1 Tax=Brucella anthropi TaxID=529 RepID=UPI0004ED8E7B|nr:glycosyltransferase [Brucella anthropi]AIK44498.1 glycosyl transferases group 1 family protein [Brucella anthropi]